MLRCVTVLSVIICKIFACPVFLGSSVFWFRFGKPQREQRKQRKRNGAGDCRTVLRCVTVLSVTICKIHACPVFLGSSAVWFRFGKPQREQREQRNGAGGCRTVLRCVKLSATLCNGFIRDYLQNLRLPRFFGVISGLVSFRETAEGAEQTEKWCG